VLLTEQPSCAIRKHTVMTYFKTSIVRTREDTKYVDSSFPSADDPDLLILFRVLE